LMHLFNLIDAAKNGNAEEVKSKVESCPALLNINCRIAGNDGKQQWSALIQAAYQGEEDLVKWLLERGATGAADANNAASTGKAAADVTERIKELLRKTEEHQHEFLDSAKLGRAEEVRSKVRSCPQLLNCRIGGRWSGLMQAAYQGNEDLVEWLLERGATGAADALDTRGVWENTSVVGDRKTKIKALLSDARLLAKIPDVSDAPVQLTLPQKVAKIKEALGLDASLAMGVALKEANVAVGIEQPEKTLPEQAEALMRKMDLS